ncbi:MAG: beta-N-acetylhexosaminidase [Desulfobacterales bacterium]|nr:beta-N-acetylhexosaminidase [Desulfobacterales bacterium]
MNIKQFSNEQLVGQRLMIGFDGTELNRNLMFMLDTLKVGGIILFSRNVLDPAQIKGLCVSVQEYARSCGLPPLFISIDQEGGQVARLKEPFTKFPGNPKMPAKEDARHFGRITAAELTGVGINMNLAPVMDVAPKDIQSVMAGRVFGNDPQWVSDLGVEVIEHLQKNGLMAVAKHFPGIGRSTKDPHVDLPRIDVDLTAMQSFDLPPFEAAIRHNVAGIMLSHLIYTKIDPQWPATLSVRIAKNLLRDTMSYDGLVITDDLDMGAIDKHYDIEIVIRQILAADIDITLICHQGPNIEYAFESMLQKLQDDSVLKQRGIKSVERIMNLKKHYLSAKT